MNSVISREVERYISFRSLPGKIGIVRVTGHVANDAVYDCPGDPQTVAYQSRDQRARALVRLLRGSASKVKSAAARWYKSVQRSRAKAAAIKCSRV